MSTHESNTQVWIPMLGLALVLIAAPFDAAAQSPASGPDEAACEGKQSGDACMLINGNSGSCGPGTCSRLDYSQGSPPKATEEACTVCSVTSPSTGGPPALGGSSGSGAASEDPSSGDAKPTKVDAPPTTSSRCSVTDRSTPSDLGWLGMLATVALAVGGWRRRRHPG